MSTEEEPDISEVADAIFNYLSASTNAVGSLEEIAQWLRQHEFPVVLEDIKRALEYLKAPGFIVESQGNHGEIVYKSAYATTEEI
jgi:Fe2+ or Zn2+ uptake regulation protein